MDATKKPLLIPPEFSVYAEKHGIFNIYERLLKRLIIEQPGDPLEALLYWLKEPENVLNVFVVGPPGVGKSSISRELSDKMHCVCVCEDDLKAYESDEELIEALSERLNQQDCKTKGWVLDDIPKTRHQALLLQTAGIFPTKVGKVNDKTKRAITKNCLRKVSSLLCQPIPLQCNVHLDAPDSVLVERVIGKRIDTLTGDVYHATFHPPSSVEIVKRLEKDPNATEPIMLKRLAKFHRNISGVLQCYQNIFKIINADQPKSDVLSQSVTYLSMRAHSNAPHTPRVILLGPCGSGKSVQAALLASKYNLVNLNFACYIKQVAADESELSEIIKPYTERDINIPDELLLKALSARLSQLDAIKRGWVLHGFPSTRNQVDAFSHFGFEANRVIALDVPSDTVIERLCLRTLDPVTGDRKKELHKTLTSNIRYHMLYNPPKSSLIKERLKTHPNDEENEVLKRYTEYQVQSEDILEFYTNAQHVNADQDLQSVFECIETIIVNPLPQKIEKLDVE